MKQNSKLMRASGILLVLTLMTSCFVGGTFAKYVSEGQGEDAARVARWGVVVTIKGDGFHTSYMKDDTSSTVQSDTVISAGEVNGINNVVAPGTKGQFGGVEITGTPEVAVKVTTTAEVTLSGWNIAGTDGTEFYCPLKFMIGDQTINGLDYSLSTAGGESSFENAIKTAIQNATTQQLEAGSNLSSVGEGITYSWEWPFENSSGDAISQSDELDTLLGNNAADDDPSNDPTITIHVTTTVTQID